MYVYIHLQVRQSKRQCKMEIKIRTQECLSISLRDKNTTSIRNVN